MKHSTPAVVSTADYNRTLFAILFPHGYTPPEPGPELPALFIEPRSAWDKDLDSIALTLAQLSSRGRRSVPSSACDNERSDAYWSAVAHTACAGYEVAESLVESEPVVAALVVEIFQRASAHNVAPATLRAQVEMQLAAVDAARRLQRFVPTAEQVKLLSMQQAELLH